MSTKPARDVAPGDLIVTGIGHADTRPGSKRIGRVRSVASHPFALGHEGDWRSFIYDTHNPGPYESPSGHVFVLADRPVEVIEETP